MERESLRENGNENILPLENIEKGNGYWGKVRYHNDCKMGYYLDFLGNFKLAMLYSPWPNTFAII